MDKLLSTLLILWACVCMCGHTCAMKHMLNERTAFVNLLFLPGGSQESNSGCWGLSGRHLYPVSHLAGLIFVVVEVKLWIFLLCLSVYVYSCGGMDVWASTLQCTLLWVRDSLQESGLSLPCGWGQRLNSSSAASACACGALLPALLRISWSESAWITVRVALKTPRTAEKNLFQVIIV